jgi:hypothetical protein
VPMRLRITVLAMSFWRSDFVKVSESISTGAA